MRSCFTKCRDISSVIVYYSTNPLKKPIYKDFSPFFPKKEPLMCSVLSVISIIQGLLYSKMPLNRPDHSFCLEQLTPFLPYPSTYEKRNDTGKPCHPSLSVPKGFGTLPGGPGPPGYAAGSWRNQRRYPRFRAPVGAGRGIKIRRMSL